MKSIHASILSLFVLSTFACGGEAVEEGDSEAAITVRSSRGSDDFIARYGLDLEACFLESTGVRCSSADRVAPIRKGDVFPSAGLFLCSESSRGQLTGCAPQVSEYACGLAGCICFGYFDC